MNSKIGPTYPNTSDVSLLRVSAVSASRNPAYEIRRILKVIFSLSLMLNCLNAPSIAQAVMAQAGGQAASSPQPGEIYAGIELTTEWLRAIALRVSRNEEESGIKLIYSENIRLALGR